MKIFITTKTRSRRASVEPLDQTNYVVSLKESPVDEVRVNEAVITALSEYFNLSKSQIQITTGHKGKRKVVEVDLKLEEEEELL